MSEKLTEIAEDSVRGAFFLFTGNALSTLILTMNSIAIARLLGPDNYGLYGLSLTAPSIFLLFTDFGVDSAIIRFSAKLRMEGRSQLVAGMLKSAFLFKLLSGAAMFTLCFTLSDSFATHVLKRPDTGPFIRLTAVLILFQATLSTANSGFLGLDSTQDNALVSNVQSVVKAASSPLLILSGLSVAGALAGHVLSYVVAGIGGVLILFLKHYRDLGGAPRDDSFSRNLRVFLDCGFPLYVSVLLGSLLGRYKSIVLAIFAANADIGNLSVAMNLVAVIGILTSPMGALFPAFSKVDPKGNEAKRLFRQSVKYTSLLIIPAATALVLLSRDLVLLVYGTHFNLAPLLLSIHVLGFLYVGMGSMVLAQLLMGAGETRLILKANLIFLSLFVPLAPALTWLYGVPGVIAAGLASGFSSLVYQLFMAKKRFGIGFTPRHSLRIYLASAMSVVPTFLFLQISPQRNLTNVILGGFIFLFSYLTFTPLAGAVSNSDVENLKLIFGKMRFVRVLIDPLLDYENKILSAIS